MPQEGKPAQLFASSKNKDLGQSFGQDKCPGFKQTMLGMAFNSQGEDAEAEPGVIN